MSEQSSAIAIASVERTHRAVFVALLVLATLVGVGVCILFVDTPIARAMPGWIDGNAVIAVLERIAYHMGEWTLAPVLLGVALIVAGRRWWYFLFTFTFAYLVQAGSVEAIKWLSGRPRPREMGGATMFYGPRVHEHSFPSGHAAFAFMFATMLSAWWPRGKVLWYSLAIYVSLSRMVANAHFLSDIIMGGLIGVLSALLILWRWPPPARAQEPASAEPGASDLTPQ